MPLKCFVYTFPINKKKLQLVAKYEKKLKVGPFGDFEKISKKIKYEVFKQRHSAENVKGVTVWKFLTCILLQTIDTNEGTLLCNSKYFEKSLILPKNSE